jgi:hypothetical protein
VSPADHSGPPAVDNTREGRPHADAPPGVGGT